MSKLKDRLCAEGLNDLRELRKKENAPICHGWIDASYHKHPCAKKAHVHDYRCPECWAKTCAASGGFTSDASTVLTDD